MTRGEVWVYEPPHDKRRPVLILTRDEHIGRQYDVIAVPSTGTPRGWDTEIELGAEDGMPTECVLNVGNGFLADPNGTPGAADSYHGYLCLERAHDLDGQRVPQRDSALRETHPRELSTRATRTAAPIGDSAR